MKRSNIATLGAITALLVAGVTYSQLFHPISNLVVPTMTVTQTAPSTPTSSVACCSISVVTPMEMMISGVSVLSSSSGQASFLVTLEATNNIGANRNYATAVVTLKSLNLNVSYQYKSLSGSSENTTFAVVLTPSFAMHTDEQKTMSVVVAPLPISAVGPIGVQVSGRPIWVLNATNTDGSQTIAYGKGLIPQFEGTVTTPW